VEDSSDVDEAIKTPRVRGRSGSRSQDGKRGAEYFSEEVARQAHWRIQNHSLACKKAKETEGGGGSGMATRERRKRKV